MSEAFETQFRQNGFASQRRYPNEALLQFIGSRYFSLPTDERKKIRVLEIGCGSGANLWMIAREGFEAYGLDSAPTGIELCREMLHQWECEAELSVGDMRKLPFADEFFDVIIDVASMQHLDMVGHKESYAEVFRCLKERGTFFQWHLGARSISFIDGRGKPVDRLTIDNIANPDVPLHGNGQTCFLTPTDARDLLQNAGLSRPNIETVVRSYQGMKQFVEYLAVTAEKSIS